VQVCPTGIDIRNGLQYECIGCSACIDACDQVMDKMGYPRGLIRYDHEHALAEHWGGRQIVRHILRPRTLVYGAILTAIVVAAAAGLTSCASRSRWTSSATVPRWHAKWRAAWSRTSTACRS
jgi:polyferredoxin